MVDHTFWRNADELLRAHRLVIDRPRGSRHPRYPDFVYPLDYGYLEGTTAIDGNAIDAWVGSAEDRALVGIVVTVDLDKRDAEVKFLLGCTPQEMQLILDTLNRGAMGAVLIVRGRSRTVTEALIPSVFTKRRGLCLCAGGCCGTLKPMKRRIMGVMTILSFALALAMAGLWALSAGVGDLRWTSRSTRFGGACAVLVSRLRQWPDQLALDRAFARIARF